MDSQTKRTRRNYLFRNGAQMTKSALASLSLDFSGKSLPAGVSFARASTGTRFNASGTMVSESATMPRFDYNPATLALRGLLVEPSSTNLVYPSNANSWTAATGVSLSANAVASPDGTYDAVKVTEDTSSGQHYFGSDATINFVSGSYYTLSAYAKMGTNYIVSLSTSSGISLAFASFDLSTGNAVSSSNTVSQGIISVGNGWYRIWISFLSGGSGATSMSFALNNNDASFYRGKTYTGTGRYLYVFGGQAEVTSAGGATSTSYIPSITASVTRAADQLSFVIPAGINFLTYSFDDNSTQKVSVSAGAYSVPTNLSRAWIKNIVGSAS